MPGPNYRLPNLCPPAPSSPLAFLSSSPSSLTLLLPTYMPPSPSFPSSFLPHLIPAHHSPASFLPSSLVALLPPMLPLSSSPSYSTPPSPMYFLPSVYPPLASFCSFSMVLSRCHRSVSISFFSIRNCSFCSVSSRSASDSCICSWVVRLSFLCRWQGKDRALTNLPRQPQEQMAERQRHIHHICNTGDRKRSGTQPAMVSHS